MNVIFILLDSLNKPYLEPYGNKKVETKNMQKLADKGVVFENHFIASAPCMPARRELFCGRKNEFLWKFWGSIEPFDRVLPTETKFLGAVSALITDHYHYWEPATGVHGYHENYMYTDLIRGHEFDNPITSSVPLEDPEDYPNWVKAIIKYRGDQSVRYYRNVKTFKSEEDFHGPKVIQSACDWLDKNHSHDKFFLHIESFDPHEPFYIPEPYRSMYGPYNDNFNCWPPYQDKKKFEQFIKDASEEELEFVRNQYCGKVTMLDRWLGKLWEKMDKYNLWENTMVILTTDHGHALMEPEKKINQYAKGHPIFEDVANIPLIIYHPEIEGGKRIDTTFSCIVDIRATILHALGAEPDDPVMIDGKSLIPVLKGEVKSIRDHMLHGIYGSGANLTTWDATYVRGFNSKKRLNFYSCEIPLLVSPSTIAGYADLFGLKIKYEQAEALIGGFLKNAESGNFIPDVIMPQWKIPVPPILGVAGLGPLKKTNVHYLFDRKKDPNFQNNLSGLLEGQELEDKMIAKMIEVLKEEGCPPEQFKRLILEDE